VIALDSTLRRERAVTALGLAVLTLLAWFYVWQGAGMGMSALDMTAATLFPHVQPDPMPGMALPATPWITVIAMWWVMMIAMMTPSAAPLVLLYDRVIRHASARGDVRLASPLFLIAGYLATWLVFAVAAAALQYALERAGLISAMVLWSKSAWLSCVVLVSVGIYQLSPLKHRCLKHCRGPVEFLTRHSRPGAWGAWVMGLEHGAWCVGCCGLLMALLFVGGVMNLVWIALITLLVLVEKLVPRGMAVGRVAGALLIIWGVVTPAAAAAM
jgi:predicted metal-binding membrane protein